MSRYGSNSMKNKNNEISKIRKHKKNGSAKPNYVTRNRVLWLKCASRVLNNFLPLYYRIAKEEAYASQIPGLTFINADSEGNNIKVECSIDTISNGNNSGSISQQAHGISANATSKPETSNTETSSKQQSIEVETIELGTDFASSTSKLRISDPNNPYAYQCNLSQEKLQKLADDDEEEMDDDSLKAFLNIVRIESGKKVIVISSHYRNRVPCLGFTKSLYDGNLDEFEVAIIPIHMPSTETAHWVLGIYRRNKSIFYYDSIGITYETIISNGETSVELATEWVAETLKSAVRDITHDTKLDLKIKAVPLDDPQFQHYCPKHRINPQMDTVNCGFHIALIAESFLMNNGEVFLENFDVAAERTRILNILSGLQNDNYRYIPRNTSKNMDTDMEMQQLDNTMNATGNNLETTLNNSRLKENNQRQSPISGTKTDEAPLKLDQKIEKTEVISLPIANDHQSNICINTKVPEQPHPEDNAQPKTNIPRENLSNGDAKEDTNEKENEKPKEKRSLPRINSVPTLVKAGQNLYGFEESANERETNNDTLISETRRNQHAKDWKYESGKKVSANRKFGNGSVSKHKKEQLHKCDECSFSSIKSSQLVIHMRSHDKIKVYECDKCHYITNNTGHLQRHMRRHTGEKSFKCEHCSYITDNKEHLERHMRAHTGEKPFKCEQCAYASGRKDKLTKHIRLHHA